MAPAVENEVGNDTEGFVGAGFGGTVDGAKDLEADDGKVGFGTKEDCNREVAKLGFLQDKHRVDANGDLALHPVQIHVSSSCFNAGGFGVGIGVGIDFVEVCMLAEDGVMMARKSNTDGWVKLHLAHVSESKRLRVSHNLHCHVGFFAFTTGTTKEESRNFDFQ